MEPLRATWINEYLQMSVNSNNVVKENSPLSWTFLIGCHFFKRFCCSSGRYLNSLGQIWSSTFIIYNINASPSQPATVCIPEFNVDDKHKSGTKRFILAGKKMPKILKMLNYSCSVSGFATIWMLLIFSRFWNIFQKLLHKTMVLYTKGKVEGQGPSCNILTFFCLLCKRLDCCPVNQALSSSTKASFFSLLFLNLNGRKSFSIWTHMLLATDLKLLAIHLPSLTLMIFCEVTHTRKYVRYAKCICG